MTITIRELEDGDDRAWARELVTSRWGSPMLVSRGRLRHIDDLPGFVAVRRSDRIGLLTCEIRHAELEVVTLDAVEPGRGTGTALLERAREAAVAEGCRRIWLITTNDNGPAVEFYRRRGYRIAAVHHGAMDEARLVKPEIPEVGVGGIPITDEIEMELVIP